MNANLILKINRFGKKSLFSHKDTGGSLFFYDKR